MTDLKTTREHLVRPLYHAQEEQNWLRIGSGVCAGSAERAVYNLGLQGAGHGLCCTFCTQNHLQGKGEEQWL